MGLSPRQRKSVVTRRKEALQLHLAGVDYKTIAEQAGFADASHARKAVEEAILDSVARTEREIDALRRSEVLRYDRLQAAFWGQAINKKDKKAADVVLKCIAGRERLQGLAAPAKVEHSGEVTTEYHIVGLDPEDLV